MVVRWKQALMTGLALLLGCATQPPPSLPQTPLKTSPSEQTGAPNPAASRSSLGIEPDELIQFVRQAEAKPQPTNTSAPEEAYGVWLAQDANRKTWLRIEKPRLRIIGIDKDKDITWVVDGHYAVAKNGTVFGILTALDLASGDKERTNSLWNDDERVLRPKKGMDHVAKDSKAGQVCRTDWQSVLPFCCEFRRQGEDLVVDQFHGMSYVEVPGKSLQGRYQKVSLGRPSYAKPVAPLSTWEYQPRGTKTQVSMRVLADRFELQILDQVSGQQLRLGGDFDLAPDGLLFGLFSAVEYVDYARGPGARVKGPLTQQPFCIRLGTTGQMLTIQEIRSLLFKGAVPWSGG